MIFALLLPKNPKNQDSKKWKDLLEISSFYTCVWNITIIWCMLPDIWSATDRIFCHYGPFFSFTPLPFLHMCTKKYDQMICGSWDMVCDRCNCYFSLGYFLDFYPLTAQKIKMLKKWKKCQEISSFYISVPKIMIRWGMVPEIWCVMDRWMDGMEVPHLKIVDTRF